MRRTTFYFDGFNFYYGLKNIVSKDPSWKKFYWIDFISLCKQFLGAEQILEKVYYFTAAPLNIKKQSRQSALFKANKLINGSKFEIIRGKYYKKDLTCPNCGIVYQKPEEKRTDVNISTYIIGDCALNKTDNLVVITADSDLVPPIQFIKENFTDKRIKVYFPPLNSSYDLRNISGRKIVYMENNKRKFTNSIMNDIVYDSDKTNSATIPAEWKI